MHQTQQNVDAYLKASLRVDPPDPIDVFFPKEEELRPPEIKTISLRVPEPVYLVIQSMSVQADTSMNAMAVHLVEWGVAYALKQMPEEMSADLVKAIEESYREDK